MNELSMQIKRKKQLDNEKKSANPAYQLGHSAGWREDGSLDDMPVFKKQSNVSAFHDGFADGRQEKLDYELAKKVDKQGLLRVQTVIKQALSQA